MLTIANAVALHQNIERYVVGLKNQVWNLDEVSMWWWNGVPSPTTIWALGVISFTAMACLLFALFQSGKLRLSQAVDGLPNQASVPSAVQ
jgi:hypothetical protein